MTALTHRRRERIGAAAIVSQLDEFLAAHVDEPICMAQLCDATGVSERSLRNACHAICGTSPKRYLTRRRMEAVRHALTEAHRGQVTVTRIATDHGFFELGRFAAAYSSLFGELPSDTLRAATAGRA
jgi:AraC-like DNA-binding protein